jgi:amino-acid N-acetyltransferase
VAPLGFDGEGRTYRINSDRVAAEIAEALKASKVIFIGTADGLVHGGNVVRQIIIGELEKLLAQPEGFTREMRARAEWAHHACAHGVPRVHIINGQVDEGLLAEVFSNEGIGSLIYANEYQQIRRALKKDLRAIMLLTKKSMASEELVKRSRSMIEKQIGDYYIFEIDRNPVACVALHPYPEQAKGELAFLFVHPSHENQGIGRKLIQYAEDKAREQGFSHVFALSTQAFSYFQSKGGFVEGTPDDLPPARREKYDASGRNSKVLVKKLS